MTTGMMAEWPFAEIIAAGLPPLKALTTLSTTPGPSAAIRPWMPRTFCRNAGLVAVCVGELTTTISSAFCGMPMRWLSRSAPTFDGGLPKKLYCAVSAPDSSVEMIPKATSRSTAQRPMVRQG